MIVLSPLSPLTPLGMHFIRHHVGEGEESPAHGSQLLLRRRECFHHATGRRKLTFKTFFSDRIQPETSASLQGTKEKIWLNRIES